MIGKVILQEEGMDYSDRIESVFIMIKWLPLLVKKLEIRWTVVWLGSGMMFISFIGSIFSKYTMFKSTSDKDHKLWVKMV